MPEAGRVIAGVARGRRLRSPGGGTRPFGDRVKQSLFASLEPMLRGARVLDLFAGSGAGGIEALSRGAAHCDFVERDAGAARVIELNLRETGLTGSGAVHRAEVLAVLERPAEPYDLVLVDPPYGDPVILAVLERLGSGASLAPGATVVAKHFWRDRLPQRAGRLVQASERRFGETTLTIYRANGGGEP
jgi:16S rRNA (guanine966-N2)-methyltransferase